MIAGGEAKRNHRMRSENGSRPGTDAGQAMFARRSCRSANEIPLVLRFAPQANIRRASSAKPCQLSFQNPSRVTSVMKNTPVSKSGKVESPEMLPESDFDYSKARPNRFAGKIREEHRIEKLFAAADRLADLEIPLSETEINAEIVAVREAKRAS